VKRTALTRDALTDLQSAAELAVVHEQVEREELQRQAREEQLRMAKAANLAERHMADLDRPSADDLADMNERLAAPPKVGAPLSDDRMGLFMVGRLSQRHGIRTRFRPSDTGGTNAVVTLPRETVHPAADPSPTNVPGQHT
jgi:hypothetical protein